MSQGWQNTGDGAQGDRTRLLSDIPADEKSCEVAVQTPPRGLDLSTGVPAAVDVVETALPTPSRGDAPSTGEVVRGVVLEPDAIVFGHYRVLSKLGQGGMGSVWRVLDLNLEVDRALKTIVQGVNGDPEARARFRREAKVMAKCNHPNAVAVHVSCFDEHDNAYIVMEYVPGRSLEKLLQRGRPMPLDWTARLLDQLCDVLQVAHDRGIVHRDLKPSNLMLVDGRPEGREQLKVLDFGIAKMQVGQEGAEYAPDAQTVVGAFMGTVLYASPEQAEGLAEPRSDLYSVGVILYELLTGFRPFSGRPMKVLNDTLHTAPPPFAEVNPRACMPAEVERVVLRCLAKSPDDRPQSALALADEFRAAIRQAAERQLPTLREEAKEPRPPRPGRGLRRIAAGAAIVLTAATLAWLRPWEDGERRPRKIDPKADAEVVKDGRKFALSNGRIYLPEGYRPLDERDLVGGTWPRVLVRRDDEKVRFFFVPGGKSPMGGPDPDHPDRVAREVDVAGFYMQEFEVTNREMEAFDRSHGARLKNPRMLDDWREGLKAMRGDRLVAEVADRHPARSIPWEVADAFARAHNAFLPTEAQWEHAARWGLKDRHFPWTKADDDKFAARQLANIGNDTDAFGTAEVGRFEKDRTLSNLWDMIGNVREWTRDVDREASPDPNDPNAEMIVRGGSFSLMGPECRFISYRGRGLRRSDPGSNDVGFRLVLECPPAAPAPTH